MTFKEKVYQECQKIPLGKVSTYKDIAISLGDAKLARAVGNALHVNPDVKKTPCHRVVSSSGRLASNYGLGPNKQQQLLEKEGVIVIDDHVDLERYKYEKS